MADPETRETVVDTKDNEPVVEMLFRNGTLTVVGILLSFSLTFVTQWAHNPLPWELVDLPTILLLVAGIGCQAYALIVFLRHDSLRRAVYDRGSKSFIIGICLTAAGVISAVVIDFIQILV
jgi:hypothetical protein